MVVDGEKLTGSHHPGGLKGVKTLCSGARGSDVEK